MYRWQNSAVGAATFPIDVELTPCHISAFNFRFPFYDLSDYGNKDTNNFGIK